MPPYCDHGNHVWTLETRSHVLAPELDLPPGRRCLCGSHVVIDPDPRHVPGDSFHVAKIGSIAEQAWSELNPALVSW